MLHHGERVEEAALGGGIQLLLRSAAQLGESRAVGGAGRRGDNHVEQVGVDPPGLRRDQAPEALLRLLHRLRIARDQRQPAQHRRAP